MVRQGDLCRAGCLLLQIWRRHRQLKSQEQIYFVDFMRDADEDPETGEMLAAPKVYEPIKMEDFDTTREKAKFYMKNFNEAYKLLKMVL